MSELLQLTKDNIDADAVDLDSLQALVTYLAVGFTFQNDFKILKFSDRSKITKAQATSLRNQFNSIIQGKPKSYLRARLPIFVVGLVEYATEMLSGVPSAARVQTFKALLGGVDNSTLNVNSFNLLKSMCTQSLARPYYTRKLNSTLDPVSSFFDGQTPNSFSNSLTECAALLDSKVQAIQNREAEVSVPTPTLTVVEDTSDENKDRVLTIIPPTNDNVKPILNVVQGDTPFFEIIPNIPKDILEETQGLQGGEPSSVDVVASGKPEDLDESEFLDKYKYWVIGGACGIAVLTFFMLRR